MFQKLENLKSIFVLDHVTTLTFEDKNAAFEHAMKIYINKPQVVNKWLAGSIDIEPIELNIDYNFELFDSNYKQFISKNSKIFKNVKYLILSDFSQTNLVIFYPIREENLTIESKYASINFTHMFHYNKTQNQLELYVNKSEKINEKFDLQLKWLTDTLLPKLFNWCLTVNINDENFNCAKLNTLTLYPQMVNSYSKLYQELKEIYWKKFSNIWFRLTNTDPEKFIHEDISIACYFILAWRYLGEKPKNFVDLGCGNGLLVHILNDQGFNGYGIDMRKRKIWSNEYYEKTSLIERTIDPKNDTFEDCDWIIGNHSDELSPWLPYIACKTSRKNRQQCNIMLIPCCFFDFNSKFEVKKNNESRYDTYLNYLENIFLKFHFKVLRDKLRIPSTKNICLIGVMDEIFEDNEDSILNNFHSDLSDRDFVARDLEQEKLKASRNCTKVDNDLKILMVQKVLNHLLIEENLIEKKDGTKWNKGRVCPLLEVAELFDKTQLAKIKFECGGIKTLLKNFHQLFVCEKDTIRVRNQILDVSNRNSKNKNKKDFIKTKICLFYLYHPDKCLLTNEECLFLHENK